jgi:DNA-binding PadR family transcriptional regulator
MNKMQLVQGTLDLLILRILELGPNHGWGISNRLQQISKDGLKTSQGQETQTWEEFALSMRRILREGR